MLVRGNADGGEKYFVYDTLQQTSVRNYIVIASVEFNSTKN